MPIERFPEGCCSCFRIDLLGWRDKFQVLESGCVCLNAGERQKAFIDFGGFGVSHVGGRLSHTYWTDSCACARISPQNRWQAAATVQRGSCGIVSREGELLRRATPRQVDFRL